MRPAAGEEYRYWFGVLFLLTIWLGLFVGFGGKFLNGSALAVYLNVTRAAVAGFFFMLMWSRFVPVKLSLVLAGLSWSTAFWVAWHYL
jgi:hypothetical protein